MRKALIAALLCTPLVAAASGFEVINVNPRDLAMSHSLSAAQRDASAVISNPAALSKLDGLNLSVAGAVLSLHTEWDAPASGSTVSGSSDTNFSPTTPYAIGIAYGTKIAGRKVGFGLGSNTPGGGEVDWDDDWQGRGRIIQVQRRMLGFYANAGVEVLPWLRVGGGGIYYWANQYFKQGVQPFPEAFGELKLTGGGFSYQLSAEVQPLENLTFGIDYKHKTTMETEGDLHLENVPPGLATPELVDQNVKEDLPFPNVLAIGAAYRVVPVVLVTLQYNYSRFRVYERDLFVGDQGLVIDIPRDYDDGHVIRGGVEWDTTDRLQLRAGLMRDFSGVNESNLSPTLPDSDTTGFSVGAGYELRPGLEVNGAFFYGDRARKTAEGSTAFPGSYKADVWIASLGVVWATGVGAGR
jgi:long-chain fatty acid transport protein